MVKPLSLYLVFTWFNPDMVSYLPLLLHAWTDLKSVFFDSVCMKMSHLQRQNPWLAPDSGGVWP